jgi:hypothetical protein
MILLATPFLFAAPKAYPWLALLYVGLAGLALFLHAGKADSPSAPGKV